ncbi:MAG: DUF4388 domain-containing protein [bacterium]
MEIKGSIEEESIERVIRVIAGLEETGILVIKVHNSAGRVFFNRGRILYVDFGGEFGESAFIKLMNISNGRYQFIEGQEIEEVNVINRTVNELISFAKENGKVPDRDEKELPSSRAMVWRKTDEISSEVTVSADEWRFLSAIRDGRMIKDIAKDLGLYVESVREIALKLRLKELIEIEEPLFTKEIPLIVPIKTSIVEKTLDPLSPEYKNFVKRYGKIGIEFLTYANGKRFVGQISALLGLEQNAVNELFKSLVKDGYLREL